MMVILRISVFSVVGWSAVSDTRDGHNLTDYDGKKYARTAADVQKMQEKQALTIAVRKRTTSVQICPAQRARAMVSCGCSSKRRRYSQANRPS